MTRFARAVGSKASNKREEEEATPWSMMVAGVKRQDIGVEDEVDYQQEGIEDEEDSATKMIEDEEEEEDDEEEDGVAMQVEDVDDGEEDAPDFGGDLKRKLPVELISQDEPSKKKKKRKRGEKCLVCGEKGHRKMDCSRLPEERRKELQDLFNMKVERKGKGTGRKKKKQGKAADDDGSAALPFETEDIERKDEVIKAVEEGEEKENPVKNAKKKKKGKPKRDKSGALVEEGEALFQGFRVTREDKERLEKLERKLKQGGVKGEELEVTLKRERRMAEKSLARSKKMVCFNCRQPGHMLAECPGAIENGGQVEAPNAGQCYKCGSLEHSSRDCKSKLKRENAYRFAVCFICKEEGHLAKACPDNPKGLYPKGGGCVFCGSVEHLKRDCPRKVEKDLAQGVRVGTIGNDLEEEPMMHVGKIKKIKQKKVSKVVAF